ncbi:MAG: hypothetical protein K8T91_19890, partial [Planctomycetes bacterium]|nr:hypothetical protein [Planctomycetota bacterium]
MAILVLGWLLSFCLAHCATAHEVDQYALPPEALVDIGDYWDHLLYDAVQGAVDETNFKIRQARLIPIGSARKAYVNHCLSHDTLAFAVRSRLPCALMAIEGLEAKLFWRNHVDAPAGKKFGHFATPWRSVYAGTPHLPDLRQLGRISFMRCSVVNIHGTLMGTDKIAHFVSMGYVGFRSYRYQLERGTPPAKAMRRAVDLNVQGLFGETGILGGLPTGV